MPCRYINCLREDVESVGTLVGTPGKGWRLCPEHARMLSQALDAGPRALLDFFIDAIGREQAAREFEELDKAAATLRAAFQNRTPPAS